VEECGEVEGFWRAVQGSGRSGFCWRFLGCMRRLDGGRLLGGTCLGSSETSCLYVS
jgi:hypothetical protein